MRTWRGAALEQRHRDAGIGEGYGQSLPRCGHLDGAQGRAPLAELVEPVVEGRLGDDHEVRAADAAELLEVSEERNGLKRLP